MTEKTKKLLLFSIIFAFSAVVIYFYMDSRSMRLTAGPAANKMMGDSGNQQLEKQIRQLESELKNDPENIQILIQLGNNYYDLDQPPKAIEYYERALALNPHNPSVLTDCAVMYYHSGNADKALEYLDSAISHKPALGQAWFNKGIILMSAKNDHEQALEVWKKYIEIDPESEQAKFIQSQIEAIESER